MDKRNNQNQSMLQNKPETIKALTIETFTCDYQSCDHNTLHRDGIISTTLLVSVFSSKQQPPDSE